MEDIMALQSPSATEVYIDSNADLSFFLIPQN